MSANVDKSVSDLPSHPEERPTHRVILIPSREFPNLHVLDDLGVECGSRFVIQKLYRIIEGRRNQRGLYTIFTSNKDARGLEEHWRPERSGAAAFDDCERIIQRIGESYVPIHLEGRSLRAK